MDPDRRVKYHAGMTNPLRITARLLARAKEARRRRRFAASVEHLHGPRTLDVAQGDVVLIALVRDAAFFLDGFFAHYRAMGIRHFVFFDTGSTDATLARIRAEPGTVIDRSTLPQDRFGDLMRDYPVQTYGRDRWCLFATPDALLDFEGRATFGIRGLTAYLEAEGHTAFAAQRLDMFPKGEIGPQTGETFEQVRARYLYFDISHLRRYEYHSDAVPFSARLAVNDVAGPQVKLMFGGVRGKVWGEDGWLTRHPLVFNGPEVTVACPDAPMGVRVADVTGVMRHYGLCRETPGDSGAALFSLDARRWNRAELLYRADFLATSDRYAAHVRRARS